MPGIRSKKGDAFVKTRLSFFEMRGGFTHTVERRPHSMMGAFSQHAACCMLISLFARGVIAVGLMVGVFSSAVAQTSSSASVSESPVFKVEQILLEGENPLSRNETRSVLKPYQNRDMTIESLREAATELEKALAIKGYNFYRATLPPQTLEGGTVRLAVARIDIADVIVTGNDYFSERNIKRSLPIVASGRSPNTNGIANALLLAEDNPAKDVRVVFVKGEGPQTVDANIAVTDKNPNELFFWANNSGSRQTTRTRLGGQYHQQNLWGSDHQIALSYTMSPEETDELNQYGVNYKIPLYSTRGMLNAFYSRSEADTGRVADEFDISGAGKTVGVAYTQYLGRRGGYQDRFKLGITDKLFDSDVIFNSANIGSDVRSRPLTLEYIGRLDGKSWLLNGILTYSENLSGGSFNDETSYSQARAGADNNWDKQEVLLRFDYRFSQSWRGRLLGFAQISSDSLIPGEKFGMGGALGDLGPRGFYEREVTVDEGYKGSIEVTRKFATKRMELGIFLDIATGDQNNPQVGEQASDTLSSVGLAYRWNIRKDLSLEADFGYVLDGVDQTFSDGTDDGDSRVHFALKYFPSWPFGGKK